MLKEKISNAIKDHRGGKRDNAGRKAKYKEEGAMGQRVTVWLPAKLKSHLDAVSEGNVSDYLQKLIQSTMI